MYTFCPNDHAKNEVVMTNAQFEEYRAAVGDPAASRHIQNILPDKDGFTPEQREYLITGYCHDCQEAIFGADDEDEDTEGENQ